MKEGSIIKKASAKNEEDLELISRYTRRRLDWQEVYTFNLILCDNDLDRDYECFSLNCLKELEKLFLGKTGIFDHNPKGSNQTARIFSTELEKEEGRKSQSGEDYYVLKAKAYMVRSQKNEDLILEIDGGIKKEVSVGCNVKKEICSVCGSNMKKKSCGHTKGREYAINGEKRLCYGVLEGACDAYEWSFVAVPAQRAAGVIKGGINRNQCCEYIACDDLQELVTKAASVTDQGLCISKKCVRNICDSLKRLEEMEFIALDAEAELREKVRKSYAIQQPEFSVSVIKSIVDKLSFCELKEVRKAQEQKFNREILIQTATSRQEEEHDFKNFCV